MLAGSKRNWPIRNIMAMPSVVIARAQKVSTRLWANLKYSLMCWLSVTISVVSLISNLHSSGDWSQICQRRCGSFLRKWWRKSWKSIWSQCATDLGYAMEWISSSHLVRFPPASVYAGQNFLSSTSGSSPIRDWANADPIQVHRLQWSWMQERS